MKRKILLLICLVLFIVSIAGVSASEDANQTITDDDMLSVSQSDVEILESADNGTFTDLQKKINDANESDVINLENDYKYVKSVDSGEITINKTLTINGNGYAIDGNKKVRIFNIVSDNVVLNNIGFVKGGSEDSGGAIYCSGGLTVSNCSFVDCSSRFGDYGGAIFCSGGLTVNGSSFVGNSARNGGAIHSTGDLTVRASNFTNNSAEYWGGAISCWDVLTVSDCSFVGSSADIGGAIYCWDVLTVISSNFTSNSASKIGGTIRSDGVLTVSDCSFVGSSADIGGAIGICGNGSIIDSSFVNNYAKPSSLSMVGGGAIYSPNNLNITGCSFENNNVTSPFANGGAVFIGGIGSVINSNFKENIANVYSSIHAGRGANGGAVYISKGNLTNCTFENNSIKVSADLSGGNSAAGGAICISNGGNMVNCSFKGNRANYPGDGGAISSTGVLTVDGCGFVDNSARNGGAISSTGVLTVDGCSFVDNSARNGGNGGAIKSSGDLTVFSSNFTDNSASNSGGAIGAFWNMGHMLIVNSTFVGNNASKGSACYIDQNEEFTPQLILINSSLLNNKADSMSLSLKARDMGRVEIEFRGYNSVLNAIYGYCSLSCSNVTFWGVDGIMNTDNSSYLNGGQNISITINNSGNVQKIVRTTDSKGKIILNLNNGNNTIYAYHPGDLYYTESNVETINVTFDGIDSGFRTRENHYQTLEGMDVIIYIDFDVDDVTGNISVAVDDQNYSPVAGGNGSSYTVSIPDLDIGNYTAFVTYSGDGRYNNASATVDIVVIPKENLTLNASTTPITVGQVAIIVVTGFENATGNASAAVGSDIKFAAINGGSAVFRFFDLVENATALISYPGDDKYNNASTSVDIIVNQVPVIPKENLTLVASTTPITVGQVAIVVVTGFENATGNASARVGNGVYFAPINGGSAVFRIQDLVENTTALISYPGDDKYNNASTSVDIIVNPAPVTPKENLTLKASTTPIYVGQVAIIVVEGFKNATGNASARVGNGIYFASIDGGIAVFRIQDLIANDTALISYLGDDNYNEASTSVDIIVNLVNTNITLSFAVNGNNVTLTADVSPADLTGEVIFNVNGENYTAQIANSKATYTLANLEAGLYVANAFYAGNATHKSCQSNEVSFNISEDYIVITAPDLEKYYHGPERFVVTLTDSKGNPVTNASVSININGNDYTRVTDDKGVASMAINLNSGVYEALTKYNNSEVKSTITIKETVSGENVTKMFRNGTQYYATFYDTNGKTLANGTAIEFNINGVFYTRYTNDKGVARMNINLNPGEYVITAKNPNSTEQYTNIITVLPTIIENYDLTKYYKNASQYSLRILDEKGNPVKAGVNVKLNINGVFYTRTSNDDGYVKMNINLEPGEYTITADYNGLMASNKIKVLSVIETHDLVMKYKDGSKFEAKILDGQGKAYPGQKVTFNINGVFYERITGDDGIARLNINLIAGEYIITTSYNGMNAANKVTISS